MMSFLFLFILFSFALWNYSLNRNKLLSNKILYELDKLQHTHRQLLAKKLIGADDYKAFKYIDDSIDTILQLVSKDELTYAIYLFMRSHNQGKMQQLVGNTQEMLYKNHLLKESYSELQNILYKYLKKKGFSLYLLGYNYIKDNLLSQLIGFLVVLRNIYKSESIEMWISNLYEQHNIVNLSYKSLKINNEFLFFKFCEIYKKDF